MNASSPEGPANEHATVRDSSIILGILSPGLLPGAVLALPLLRHRRILLAVGLCAAAPGSILLSQGWLTPGWELLLLVASVGLAHFQGAGSHGILGALAIEALFGPLWVCGLLYGQVSVPSPVRLRMRWRPAFRPIRMEHPRGAIRLGVDMARARAVDILIDLLAMGMAIFGSTGSGKSWTVRRALDGVIANGGSALVIDAKGPSLAADIETVASECGVPMYTIDPDDPATFSYDPLLGSPAGIMNKLIGALVGGVSGDAAIYRQLAASALPATAAALRRADRLSLKEIAKVFSDIPALAALSRADGDPALREIADQASRDRTMATALSGMAGRIRSVTAGSFGPVLSGEGKPFDWTWLDQPCIAYVSLSTLGTVVDSALMARIVLADAQQWVARRMAAVRLNPHLPMAVIVLEEMTAVTGVDHELEGLLLNLLLQSRSARTGTIVTAQTLPVSPVFRQAVLGVGTMIAMRLTKDDSETVAGAIGTREAVDSTWQTSGNAPTGTGSARLTHSFKIHPQYLRDQLPGCGVLHQASREPVRVRVAASSAPITPRFNVVGVVRSLLRRRQSAD